eukprot:Tamp_19779.p3 GENE.Tamp_19779~~Tamp_19779.p3  ORF type:complete len:121 (+),score=23.40 Tamp_19779:498-860(+)
MNSLVPYELAGQGVLISIVALNWLFSFSSLKLFLLLLMGSHLALQGMRYADKKLVDASRIWDKTHKNDVQRQIIVGLVCGGIAFFGLLYNLVCACVFLSAHGALACVRCCCCCWCKGANE